MEATVYKKHSNLKFLIGIAVDKEKLAKNPYEKFEIQKNIKAQNHDVLTEEELKRLQAVYLFSFRNKRLILARLDNIYS